AGLADLLAAASLTPLLASCLALGLDGLLVDLMAHSLELGAVPLGASDREALRLRREKRLALLVAFEPGGAELLRRWMRDLPDLLDYSSWSLYLGIPCEDREARDAAEALSGRDPRIVPVVQSCGANETMAHRRNSLVR